MIVLKAHASPGHTSLCFKAPDMAWEVRGDAKRAKTCCQTTATYMEYYKHFSNRFRAHLDVSQPLFYLAVAKPQHASHNSVLTCPVLTTKLCSFKLPPADADAHPLGTSGKYRQVYKHVCVRVCVSSGRKKSTQWWTWGEEERGSAWLSIFFSHTALTKAPLFWQPVSRGDALMIACCLSHGSRLNLRSGGDAPVSRAFMVAL